VRGRIGIPPRTPPPAVYPQFPHPGGGAGVGRPPGWKGRGGGTPPPTPSVLSGRRPGSPTPASSIHSLPPPAADPYNPRHPSKPAQEVHRMRPRLVGAAPRRFAAGAMIAAAAIPLAAATATAQPQPTRPETPPHFAITNARIVPVAGPVIENGTVVVRDGIIRAVGANVQAPTDAWVIDGTGLTVYPGLMDAFTTLGHPERRGAQAGGPP